MKRSYDQLNNSNLINKAVSPNEDSVVVDNPGTSSGAAMTSLKTTLSSLPRVPQISRKVRACSACKKQKIRCDFDSEFGAIGDTAKCVRCRKMKLECVVNRSLQTILDEDVEWKLKMSEELIQLQRAVEDILRIKQMRPLSTYSSPIPSAASASSCSPVVTAAPLFPGHSPPRNSTQHPFVKESLPTIIAPPISTTDQSPERPTQTARMPMTRENSPQAPDRQNNTTQPAPNNNQSHSTKVARQIYDPSASIYNASISTNPMGSLYEVTRLRSLRSNSTTNVHTPPHVHCSLSGEPSDISNVGRHTQGPSGLGRHMSLSVEDSDDDLISKGLVTIEEAEDLFELFRSTLNHYLFDVALVHDNLSSVRNSSSLLLASILTVASLHRPRSGRSCAGNQHATTPTASGTFAVCYQHFLTLVSSSMFEPPGGVGPHALHMNGFPPYQKALDNVRALSIAAFWLPDLSWKLSGHAVRIATELNVHQSFRKALMSTQVGSKMSEAERMKRFQERKFHYERARLWYLLYVCDHHFSIAYGRPPVICYSQHEAIKTEGYERYLTSDLCNEGDFRVVSQMALFVVLERIYEYFAGEISEGGMVKEEVLFGGDRTENCEDDEDTVLEEAVPIFSSQANIELVQGICEGSILDGTGKKRSLQPGSNSKKKKRKSTTGKVEQFCRDLDAWRNNWTGRLRKNAYVGDYPAKGVLLHFHFAKLQLHSLALRGVTGSVTHEISSADIIATFSPQRTSMARVAIESAKHVLTTVLTVQEIRVCLIGVPLYVHTMIAFAAVFLMKVTSRWRRVDRLRDLVNPTEDIWSLVEKVVEVLRDVACGGTGEGGGREGSGPASKERQMNGGPSLRGADEMHIVWYIIGGLEKMAKKCRALVQKEDEGDELGRIHAQGKWEAVWQEAGRGSQGLEDIPVERQVSADAVPPGLTGTGIMHPVALKHEEQGYTGAWGTQPPAFDATAQTPHSPYPTTMNVTHNSPHDQPGSSTLHPFPFPATAPADTDCIYSFGSSHSHDNQNDSLSIHPPIYSLSGFTPYEFFHNGGSGPVQSLNGSPYFSFANFDLFGGGTMEAIPIAGAVGGPMRTESIVASGLTGPGAYTQYLGPPGPANDTDRS